MSNVTINQLPVASTIDPVNDLVPIFNNGATATQAISRNTYLGLASAPVGLTDSQTLTNKILTSPTLNTPTIASPTFSGTLSGTYTIGGTPTFPSSVVTLTGSQTLTNKVLTAPTITNATISADTVSGFSASTTGTIYGISVTTGAISSALSLTSTLSVSGLTTLSGLTVSSGTTQLLPTLKNPYKFGVYRNSAANTGNNTFGLITFDTVEFDTGTNYSTGTGRFTAPIAGFYQFTYGAGFTASAGFCVVALFKNGSEVKRGIEIVSAGATDTEVNGAALLQLSANDFIQVFVQSPAANPLATGATRTYFQGFLVSAT